MLVSDEHERFYVVLRYPGINDKPENLIPVSNIQNADWYNVEHANNRQIATVRDKDKVFVSVVRVYNPDNKIFSYFLN